MKQMSRIGKPLTEEVAKPRFNPKTLPIPQPTPAREPASEPEPAKKEPVKVGTPAENLIHRVAAILGVSDDWVSEKILEIAGRVEALLSVGSPISP